MSEATGTALADERGDEVDRLSRRVEQLVAHDSVAVELASSVARLDDKVSATAEDVSLIKSALFGNPLDAEDTGMAGALRDIRTLVTTGHSQRMERLYLALLGVLGTLIVAAVALH